MTTTQNHIRNSPRMAVFGLAVLLASSAYAADPETERWYQVELIVFTRLSSTDVQTEVWPENPGHPDTSGAIRLLTPEEVAAAEPGTIPTATSFAAQAAGVQMPALNAYELLPVDAMQLNPVEIKLARSAGYRPLLHVAWRQPTVDPEHAQTIVIDDRLLAKAADNTATDLNPPAGGDSTEIGPQQPTLSGTVKLGVSRYLHLAVDLVYRVKSEEQVLVKPAPQVTEPRFSFGFNEKATDFLNFAEPHYETHTVMRGYRLNEVRRMRSEEIHYFDHPLLGVIAKVVPVELPKAGGQALPPQSFTDRIGPPLGSQ